MQDEMENSPQFPAEFHQLRQRDAEPEAEPAECKDTEKALYETGLRHSLALEAGQIGTWDWDLTTGKHTWSKTQEMLFGYAPGTYPGTFEAFVGRIHPDDAPGFQDAGDRAKKTGDTFRHEFRVVWPDGSTRWLTSSGRYLYDPRGRPNRVVGVTYDISHRKHTENALERALTKYRTLFDSFPLGITVSDKNGKIIETNREAERLLGVSPDAHLRRDIDGSEWRIVRPDGTPMPSDEYASVRALREQRMIENVEMGIVKSPESTAWLSVTAAPLPLPDYGVVISYGDVSSRKQAEKALLASEGRFRSLMKLAPVPMALVEQDGRVLFLNDRWTALFGYTQEDIPTLSQWWPSAFPDSDMRIRVIEKWERAVEKAARTSTLIKPNEYTVTCKDGTVRIVEISGLILGNEVMACFIDLTERKRTEEDLRFHKMILEQAGKTAKVGGWRFNAVTGDGIWTDEVARIHDLDPALPATRDIGLQYYTDESRMKIKTALNHAVLHGTPYDLELELVSAKGIHKWVRTIGNPIRENGRVLWVQGSFQEITDQKKTQDALRESEAHFRGYFELGLIGMAITSPQKGWVEFNDRLCDIFGYSREELAKLSWEEMTHPDDLAADVAQFDRVVRGEIDSYQLEKRFIRKDGEIIHAEISAKCVRNDDGRIDHFVAMVQDITERKQAEKDRERLEARLRQAQKLEAVGTLAGGIAHDFNNILYPIIGYTEMAMDDIPETSHSRSDLAQVLSAANRAKNLVKQILSFSRTGEDHRLRPLDIGTICKEALKLMRASIPSTVEIRQNIESCVALADPTQIHQVIVNLCMNAAHAVGDMGRMEISLSKVLLSPADTEKLLLPHLKPGPCLKLSVSDSGKGMNAEVLQRIFEPYFTTKEVGKGTGLGLAVVHGIVKRHGGEITVRSKPGEGSTFEVYLPGIAEKPADATLSSQPLPGGSERILVVDDEATIAIMAGRMLAQQGYEVTTQSNSTDALQIFLSDPQGFDLVITDFTMPRLTGIDLAREMFKVRPGIPVILCTGYNEKATEAAAGELGIKGFVMKPLDRKQLINMVRKVLDR